MGTNLHEGCLLKLVILVEYDFHGYSKLLGIFFVIFFNFVFLNSGASTNTQQNA